MMGEIYQNANTACIWLGPDPADGLAFQVSRKIGLTWTSTGRYWLWQWRDETTEEEKDAFRALIELTYWTRQWIAQEVALSINRVFMYGRHQMSWDDLKPACLKTSLLDDEGRIATLIYLADTAHEESDDRGIWLDAVIYASRSFCENPRDKMYGTQSMFRPDLRVKVNYVQSVRKTYLDMVQCWFYRGELYMKDLSLYEGTDDFVKGCVLLAISMQLMEGPILYQATDEVMCIARDIGYQDSKAEQWKSLRWADVTTWRKFKAAVCVHILKEGE